MKLSSFALKTSALLLVSAVLYGTTYATSLVTPQTNICVKISNDYSAKALSLSIKPYYNNKVITDIGIYSDNGTCIKVDRDWLLGGAKPGTSFVVTGKDRNNRTYLLENRDIAMFRNTKDIKEKAWLSIKYDINSAVNSSGTLLIGSVTSEFHIYEAGAVETVTPPKGIYRSDLTAMDSLNAMRQIGATKYTNITDFKGKDNVTREQAAKFFVAAWQAIHPKEQIKEGANTSCAFSDSSKIDTTLAEYVRNACKLGLMKGSQGAFNPQNTLTLAEAITVLVRMQYGLQNETYTPWYRAYFDQAFSVELFDGFAYNPTLSDGNLPITREMIGFLMRRLLEINNIQPITYPTI